MVYSFEPELSVLTKELNLQKIDKPTMYWDVLSLANDLSLFENKYNIGIPQVSDKFKTHIGLDGENPAFAGHSYDAVRLIIRTFEKSSTLPNDETFTDEAVNKMYQNNSYLGEMGEYTLDSSGQFRSQTEIDIVKDSKIIPIEQ